MRLEANLIKLPNNLPVHSVSIPLNGISFLLSHGHMYNLDEENLIELIKKIPIEYYPQVADLRNMIESAFKYKDLYSNTYKLDVHLSLLDDPNNPSENIPSYDAYDGFLERFRDLQPSEDNPFANPDQE